MIWISPTCETECKIPQIIFFFPPKEFKQRKTDKWFHSFTQLKWICFLAIWTWSHLKKKNSKSESENAFTVATDSGLKSKLRTTKNHILPFKWDTHTSYRATACIKYVFTLCLLCLNKNLDKKWSVWQYNSDLCTRSTGFHCNFWRDSLINPTNQNTSWKPNTEYVSRKYL